MSFSDALIISSLIVDVYGIIIQQDAGKIKRDTKIRLILPAFYAIIQIKEKKGTPLWADPET